MEKESEWILPEVLEKLESESRQTGDAAIKGDFRSYNLLNRGVASDSEIALHNCVGAFAKFVAITIKHVVDKYDF